jgi:uncharacterized membrane protein YgcG
MLGRLIHKARERFNPTIILLAALVWLAFPSHPTVVAQDSGPQDSDQTQAAPPPEQSEPDQGASDEAPYAKLSKAQLERLVAPIALYPDALVAQVLASSTYPTEITDAEDWLQAHPGLSSDDLAKQVNQQNWDPSVKALVQYPSVLANLSKNLGWTSELGDAYYNQQEDVIKAVQEMRKKAKKAGNLNTTSQLNVADDEGRIDITPVDPNVVYVPAYDPWLVYGYPIAPWPYWVEVPGIWWGGPGIYFGVGFPIAPFFGFGWGWGAWGVDWHHYGVFYNRAPYFARGPAFFDRGAYYGGRPGFANPGGYRGAMGNPGNYRGFSQPPGGTGVRSGAFSGVAPGGMSRGFSARGQSSFGGFGGGGFHGGGFGGGSFGGGRR